MLPDDLIDARTAAKLAGNCHLATVHRWVLSGRLRGWRRGGRWFVSRADVLGLFTPHDPSVRPAPVAAPRPRGTPEHVREKARRLGIL